MQCPQIFILAFPGIASLLLKGGRTAHSTFKIPIEVDDSSTCQFSLSSELCDLLRATRLIVWDEITASSSRQIECVDRTLRDVMRHVPGVPECIRNGEVPFGGIMVLPSGDFRQVAPVAKDEDNASSADLSFRNSPLWSYVRLRTLTVNKRLHTATRAAAQYLQFLKCVGDGSVQGLDILVRISAPAQTFQ